MSRKHISLLIKMNFAHSKTAMIKKQRPPQGGGPLLVITMFDIGLKAHTECVYIYICVCIYLNIIRCF